YGAVERSAERLADGCHVETEVSRALTVQLDRELLRTLVSRHFQVLETRYPAQSDLQVLADTSQHIEIVAGDRQCDGPAGRVGAQSADARRTNEDACAREPALVHLLLKLL